MANILDNFPMNNPLSFSQPYDYQGVVVENYRIKKLNGRDYFVFSAQKKVDLIHILYGRVRSSTKIEEIIPNRIFTAYHTNIEIGIPFEDMGIDDFSFLSFSIIDFSVIKFYNYYLTSQFDDLDDLEFEYMKTEAENENELEEESENKDLSETEDGSENEDKLENED
ncbi:hypothetical protein KQX54_013725 [Cotesia glomerata]|uniref:Uncharacterized protein n=1 Tax=Cotesia glomerata TaxID=32391 RepID=A0AAV7IVC3_COTGL|nr:hypothetical protein KQX54_013725 [Cotesia glomerata]